MTKDEYINQAVKSIKNKRDKRLAAEEISDHIDDRIGFYTDCGYDYETSLQKAIGQMGDPEDVGEKLGKVHTNSEIVILVDVAVGIIIQIFIPLFMSLMLWPTATTDFFPYFEIVPVIFIICSIITNKFHRHKVLNIINFVFCTEFLIYYFFVLILSVQNNLYSLNFSPESVFDDMFFLKSTAVTTLYCIITGNAHTLAAAAKLHNATVDSIPVIILTAIYFGLLFYIVLKNCFNLFKVNSPDANKKDYETNRYIFKQLLCFACFIAVTFVSYSIVTNFSDISSDGYYKYNGFYVVESDEPIDFDKIDYSQAKEFSFKTELFKEPYDIVEEKLNDSDTFAFGTETEKADLPMAGAQYEMIVAYIDFDITKKYVAVVPSFFDSYSENYEKDTSETQWYDTQDKDQITCCIKDCDYPQMKYVINLRRGTW